MNPLLNYNEQQRTSYLVILSSIATADHENSQEEIAFMQQMCAAAELGQGAAQEVTLAMQNPGGVNFQQHFGALQGSDLKYSLLADLVNLTYKDGEMEQTELAQIGKINQALGINEQQFQAVVQYVQQANKQAESQEGTPGVMGFLGGNNAGGGLGSLLGMAGNFLSQSGLLSKFQQAGIPTQNFESGSTIGTVLTGLATNYLQQQMGGAQQQQQQGGGGLGGLLGGLAGSLLQGQQQGGQQQGGLGGLISNILSNPQSQQMVTGLIQKALASNQQGNGLGNLSDLLGGGKQNANVLGGLIGMFAK